MSENHIFVRNSKSIENHSTPQMSKIAYIFQIRNQKEMKKQKNKIDSLTEINNSDNKTNSKEGRYQCNKIL